MIRLAFRECARLHAEALRMLFALGWSAALAGAVWQTHLSFVLRSRPEFALPAASPSAAQAPDRATPGSAYAAVSRLHLFGLYRPPGEPPPPPAVVKEVSSDFRLQGVFTGRDEIDAAALIATGANTSARRFMPGDPITEGTELVSVALDHVVLRRDGELQRLSLHRTPDSESGGSGRAPGRRAPIASRARRTHTAALAPEPGRASLVMARLRRLRASEG